MPPSRPAEIALPPPAVRFPYAPHWRAFDLVNAAAERLLPARLAPAVPLVLLLPALLLVTLLTVGLLLVAEQSFHSVDPATFLLHRDYTWRNYRVLLARPQYLEFGGRALLAAVVVAGLCLLLGFPYAFLLVRTRSAALRKALICCIFVPFLIGPVVRAFAWIVVLGRTGLVNAALRALGLAPVELVYNLTGVLIGLTQLLLPITILILVPAITAIRREVEDAAASLGAHWLRVAWTVTLPLAAPGLGNGFVIVWTLAFSDMAIPAILGGGRADFITNIIQRTYVEAGDRGVGGALCVATTLVTLAIIGALFLARRLGPAGRRSGP